MRVPSSTPWGMLTESWRSLVTRPAPLQAVQGSSIFWPLPWQGAVLPVMADGGAGAGLTVIIEERESMQPLLLVTTSDTI